MRGGCDCKKTERDIRLLGTVTSRHWSHCTRAAPLPRRISDLVGQAMIDRLLPHKERCKTITLDIGKDTGWRPLCLDFALAHFVLELAP
jgi:hypothetical protein